MSTFLLQITPERKVNTVEHGLVRGLVIASMATVKSSEHARDYGKIVVGDHVIGCNSDGIRWKALIEEVVDGTDSEPPEPGSARAKALAKLVAEKDGQTEESSEAAQVRVLKGSLVARGSRSIAAASKRMKENGVDLPVILNARGSGFRQGALACELNDDQIKELESSFK